MSRKKKRKRHEPKEAELNIMPFIDIFSMLNTFLLVSAAFVNIGLIEVQVPFLTNAPPPKDKPPRSLLINVAIDKDKVELETKFDAPPLEEKKTEYALTDSELMKLHKDLVKLRQDHPDSDKVDVYAEDDVLYNRLVKVLDAIKFRTEGDPIFKEKDPKGNDKESDFIYRKVVMAGVIL